MNCHETPDNLRIGQRVLVYGNLMEPARVMEFPDDIGFVVVSVDGTRKKVDCDRVFTDRLIAAEVLRNDAESMVRQAEKLEAEQAGSAMLRDQLVRSIKAESEVAA